MLSLFEVILLTILVSVLGICIGSFINVIVFRTKEGISLGGRSKCRACLEPIAAIDLVPVASFFALKGRCRKCSSVIEWQYPAIELTMGILFGLFFVRAITSFGFPEWLDPSLWLAVFIRDALIACFLLIIFVYDFKFSYILDRFSLPAIIIALLFNLALGAPGISLLAGGLIIGGFFAVQFLVSHGTWIGGGDIRMGMLMGFLLGIELGVVALFLSYVLGAIIGIGLILSGKRTMKSHVPFGTFMSAAIILTMLFGPQILEWYLGYF